LNYKCIPVINFSQVFLHALSRTNPTKLNGRPIALDAGYALCHKDIFTIGDRHFRWEYSTGKVDNSLHNYECSAWFTVLLQFMFNLSGISDADP
jgi:hypothetical protein